MARKVETGIEITGRDAGATKVIQSVKTEAAGLRSTVSNLGEQTKDLPSHFGKAAAAMSIMGSATGSMGGKIADAGAKITDVALMLAVGGPLGVGLAAVTGAIALASTAWDAFTEDQREAEAAAKKTREEIEKSTKALQDQKDALDDMVDAFDHWGETVEETGIRRLREQNAVTREGLLEQNKKIIALEKEAELLERGSALVAAAPDEAARIREQIAAEQEKLRIAEQSLTEDEKRLNILVETKNRSEETSKAVVKGKKQEKEAIDATAIAERAYLDAINRTNQSAAESQANLINIQVEQDKAYMVTLTELAEEKIALDEAVADKRAELAEKNATATKREADARIAANKAMAAQVVTTTQGLIAAGQQGTDATKDFVKQQIVAYAAVAAARGMESAIEQLGMPLGLIAGAAFAAAALGATLAFGQGLNQGGFVRGGVAGRDSVNVRATPGEYVASTGEVSGFLKFASRLLGDQQARDLAAMAGMSRGGNGTTPQAAPQQSTSVQIVNKTWVPDSVAMMKMSRRQAKSVVKLRQRGMA
jgi:hypothetical protein